MGRDDAWWAAIIEAAHARAVSWLAVLQPIEPDGQDQDATPDLIEGARLDSDAFAFTRRLLEAVAQSADPFASALSLREASKHVPVSMPAIERLAVRASGLASLGLPWAVLPVARKWLRERVSHLVLSTKLPASSPTESQLAALRDALRAAGAEHIETVCAPGGVKVLGAREAETELQRLITLASLPEVTHLAVSVARLAPSGLAAEWALDDAATRGAKRLRELLRVAQQHHTAVTLEPSDYRSALLAPLMLLLALEEPGLEKVQAGVALTAELPESLLAAQSLIQHSHVRTAAGATPLEITIGFAGFAGREQIESTLSGLAVPTLHSRESQVAQWLRILALLLAAGDAVRTVAASEDLLLLALATVLAEADHAQSALTLQVRAGTVAELETVIAEHDFRVRRRLAVVSPDEFSGAVEYLIALSAEVVTESSVLARSRSLMRDDRGALTASLADLQKALEQLAAPPPKSHRVQQRLLEWDESARETVAYYRDPTEGGRADTGGLTAAVLGLTRSHTGVLTVEVAGRHDLIPVVSGSGFANEPQTDATRFENREWMRRLFARARRSDIGMAEVAEAEARAGQLEGVIAAAIAAAVPWGALRPMERGARVSRLARATAEARANLVEVLAAESGAPAHDIDAQVNDAVDAARYLGQRAGGLGVVRGAKFTADRLMCVVVDAGTPLGGVAEAVLGAVATGSAVLVLAHPSIARSTAVMLAAWREAGLPEGVATLLTVSQAVIGGAGAADPGLAMTETEEDAHRAFAAEVAADPRIERALVHGARGTAEQLLRRRPELRVQGRFNATATVLVTSTADPVLAAEHVVASAFGAGHASPNAARVLVLLGAIGRSPVFLQNLEDLVSSLTVGDSRWPGEHDPLAFVIGPLPVPPGPAGLRALTELAEGETWLVQPEQLDDEGLLWRPGVRLGVKQHATFWHDAIGMPVLGIITAHTLDGAISLVNQLGGGGVSGLHASDAQETIPWLERVESSALFVGRPTTGARVERQPGAGWGAAGMGAGVLAAGPNRLVPLGSWQSRQGTASTTLHLRGISPEVRVLIEVAQASLDYQSFDRVRRAVLSDTLTWRTDLGKVRDISGLGVERNLLRRLPVATHVRLAERGELADLVRVLSAGLVVRAPMTVSTGVVLPGAVSEFLDSQGITVSLERDDAWLERLAVAGLSEPGFEVSRVRLIGGDRARTVSWLGDLGAVSVWAEPVTMAGPVELLTFVREQSVSIIGHRHGLVMLPAGVGSWISELQGR